MQSLSIKILLATVLVAFGMASHAGIFEHKEYAAEVMKTEFGNAPQKNGIIYVKRCDQCTVDAVSFSRATVYFDGGNQISTADAMKREGSGATIFFDPASKYVTRVIFWSGQ